MSEHKQPCPACESDLELPIDSVGKLALCPACNTQFTVGETLVDTPKPSFASGTLPIQNPLIEEIVSDTVKAFSSHKGVCIAIALIAAAGICIAGVVPIVIVNNAFFAGDLAFAVLAILIGFPVAVIGCAFAMTGCARANLAILRGSKTPTNEFRLAFPHTKPWAIASGIIFGGMVFAIGGGLIARSALVPRLRAAPLVNIGFLAAAFLLFATLLWLFWSSLFVCADGKANGIGSLRTAIAITSQNPLNSFFLVLLATILAICGTIPCFVGHVVTVPVTVMMFTIAYLKVTGQETYFHQDS